LRTNRRWRCMPKSLSVRQFDSVGVLPFALVLFRQDFFEPPCLLFGKPLIHGLRRVADDELLAAAVAPERSHLLEACSFLSAALFHRYRPHFPILVGNSIDGHNWKAALALNPTPAVGFNSAANPEMLPKPKPRAMREHFVVSSIRSGDVSCAEWSNIRGLEHLLELFDVVNSAFNVHASQSSKRRRAAVNLRGY
jgi:hypothetical protein